MSALDAETAEAIRAAVRQELAALLGFSTGPPPLQDRPALHEAAPIRAKALGPLQEGGCEAVVYDGSAYRRCSHPATMTRDGHRSCGVHGKQQLTARWADGDAYSGW